MSFGQSQHCIVCGSMATQSENGQLLCSPCKEVSRDKVTGDPIVLTDCPECGASLSFSLRESGVLVCNECWYERVFLEEPLPLEERSRGDEEGSPFPVAAPFKVPVGAKGMTLVYCETENCGFYTVSPYTIVQWRSIGRESKVKCPLCKSDLRDSPIEFPMRVSNSIPVVDLISKPKGLLGKGRNERWDYVGGPGYFKRMVTEKGEKDREAWEKMQRWAKGGSAADVASEKEAKETKE